MNTVYKITNMINQKSYIGSSTRVEKRWQQHKNDAFNSSPKNKKYQYPLYQAFRKYGIENFSFEILKDGFSSTDEMEKYEQEMIFQYQTLAPNGYNQTENTNSNATAYENTQKYIKKISKKCALVNEDNEILSVYNSYHDAARAQGYDGDDWASNIKKICEGKMHSCNGLIFRLLNENGDIIVPAPQTRKKKTAIRGISITNPSDIVYYDSISQASREEHICRNSITLCLAGSTRYSHVGGRKWERIGDKK